MLAVIGRPTTPQLLGESISAPRTAEAAKIERRMTKTGTKRGNSALTCKQSVIATLISPKATCPFIRKSILNKEMRPNDDLPPAARARAPSSKRFKKRGLANDTSGTVRVSSQIEKTIDHTPAVAGSIGNSPARWRRAWST
jgi:hypothetical protein